MYYPFSRTHIRAPRHQQFVYLMEKSPPFLSKKIPRLSRTDRTLCRHRIPPSLVDMSANDNPRARRETIVHSSDGTPIAFTTIGTGPSILIIPGALETTTNFIVLADVLSARFTVHTIERRGRRASGPQGDKYSIDRECEDLLVVADATNATMLFGHSFGGFVALETAVRDGRFDKIAVYEPGLSIDGSMNMTWTDRCNDELKLGRPSDAFITFIRGVNPSTSRIPRWLLHIILRIAMNSEDLRQKYALLPTAIPEHAEIAKADNTYHRYADIGAKVLVLVGKDTQRGTPGWPSTKLAEVLRKGTTSGFPKLDHFGPEKSPKEVGGVLGKFFASNGIVQQPSYESSG
jgi:pimeloyl-ACP methyl ester carboxylesterase